jgi:hypothetical protein
MFLYQCWCTTLPESDPQRIETCRVYSTLIFKMLHNIVDLFIFSWIVTISAWISIPLSLGIYLLSKIACFCPWPALCGIFPILLIWQGHCCNYWRAWTYYRKDWWSQHFISRSALKFQIYEQIFAFLKTLLFLRANYFELMKNVK